jgi:hypothetical protein
MAQWAAEDGPVLEAVWRVLRTREHAAVDDVLAVLAWGTDRRTGVLKSMKLLVNTGHLGGPVLEGAGGLIDVVALEVTEKGLLRLGQWTDANQDLVAALIAALNKAADQAEPKEATALRTAAGALERILHDVSVGVLMSIYQDIKTRLGIP